MQKKITAVPIEPPFPCTSCGICCMHIKDSIEKARAMVLLGDRSPHVVEVAEFPYKYDETGKCENLMDDHRCKVYKDRPDVCDVALSWKKFEEQTGMPRKEYFVASASMCNSLIIEAKADDKYLIDLEKIK